MESGRSEGAVGRNESSVARLIPWFIKMDAGIGCAGQIEEQCSIDSGSSLVVSRHRMVCDLKYREELPFWRGELERRICGRNRVELLLNL